VSDRPIETSLAPWLTVGDGGAAVDYYTRALGAVEVYRLDDGNGGVAVARLQVGTSEFWVQGEPGAASAPGPLSVRMILTVDDPDGRFERAVAEGATPVAPVSEEYGWRTGRVTDPFGHDWEFSRPIAEV